MKRVDGTDYQLLDTGIEIDNGNDGNIYYMKFLVQNDGNDVDLSVKVWQTDDTGDWTQEGTEPQSWTSVTDDGTVGGSAITGTGRFGLYYELHTNRWTQTDNYTATPLD